MAFTLLDSGVAGFSDGNTGHVYTFPAGAASAGDLLVLPVSSDTVVSTPSGWSVATSDVHNIGAYVFYKVAAGGETGVTVTTSGNFATEVGYLRYSGATGTPLDATAVAFNVVSSNTTPAATATLAGSGELVVAAACLGGMGGGTPNTPNWTSGYTNRLDGQTAGTGTTDTHLFVADRYDGTGSQSPNCTWISNANNQTLLVAAFLPAVGTTSKTDGDTGALVEAASITASLTAADAGISTDAASLTAAASSSDSATSTEAASLTVTIAASDTATGTESGNVTALLLSGDTATAAESAAVTLFASDTAHAIDTATLTSLLAAVDTALATDGGLLTATLLATETTTAVEAAQVTRDSDVPQPTSVSGTARPRRYGGTASVTQYKGRRG